jgi:hypothetical protein
LGITEKLCVTRDGWTFEGCAWCGGGVFVSEGYLKCSNDHRNPRVTPRFYSETSLQFILIIRCISYSYCCFVHRYKLHVQVRHNQDRAIFVISDPTCANFFGISALELKRSLSVVCRSHLRYGIILTFITCALLNHLKYIMHLILG